MAIEHRFYFGNKPIESASEWEKEKEKNRQAAVAKQRRTKIPTTLDQLKAIYGQPTPQQPQQSEQDEISVLLADAFKRLE